MKNIIFTMHTRFLIYMFAISFNIHLDAQIYSFEPLTIYGKHKAPREIQDYMMSNETKRYSECVKDLTYDDPPSPSYFNAIPIKLSHTKERYFLVLPTKYCPAFFGSHAISFWVLKQDLNYKLHLLFTGQSDGISIQNKRSNGLKNIVSRYGADTITLMFDRSSNSYIRSNK